MTFDINKLKWTREPADYMLSAGKIEIVTAPNTDLWQRTYYHFRNDNAPVLQMETDEKFFSFVVKTEFDSKHRFDQCGIVMYLDSDNWLKASIEYENEKFQHLGSVVTNNGYSDWATTEIDADVKSMWYRFSRRDSDYCIECSEDGVTFKQMRVCHMWNGAGEIKFGIYACSPENSSFKATFTNMEVTECKWLAHDGQQPDEDYKVEAQEKWGETDAYKEHAEKTKNYSKDKWNNLTEEMNGIFAEFAVCMKNGAEPESPEAQELVKTLQNHITENYYLCTNEILAGLGQMYVADERFKNNIDKNADGVAEFICKAIEVYCRK